MKKYIYIMPFALLMITSSVMIQHSKSIHDFTLKNAVDGEEFSLSSYRSAKGVVVIFTSNYCPYAKLYENRIQDLAEAYQDKGIRFILINPNNPERSKIEGIQKMAEKARAKSFEFPYLSDSEQKVADMFGAEKTPEAYLLKNEQGAFRVVYKGAIDDNPQVASDVSQEYLKDAIDKVLQNRSVGDEDVRPTGCVIRR